MTVGESKVSNLNVRLRSGICEVRIKPLFTHDSKCLIIASGADVKVYNIQSGECLHTLRCHKGRIVSLQENKRNRLQIFSCCENGDVARWDYCEGHLLQVHKMHTKVVGFYAPLMGNTWFIVEKIEENYTLCSVVPKEEDKISIQDIIRDIAPGENSVAFGFEGKFVAAVYENSLKIFQMATNKFRRHLTGERNLKCVICHPTDLVVATGDNQGRVLIWSNIMDSRNAIKSIYHWHSLPVSDIAFSTEGSYLYSGGGEAVLVKWNLFSGGEPLFTPRLGAPICHLNVSPDNTYVVLAQNDNSLQVINAQGSVVQVIQGLTQGHFQGAYERKALPAGLLYDSLTKALVLNGKPGHLQFYNIHEDKHMFNLDITGRNFICQERDASVLNIDVQKAAIDERGEWLATAEYWNDEESSPQIWLKFWHFDSCKQMFVLSTNVILPHNKEVNCILFQPLVSQDDPPVVVTTSSDGRFKVWLLKEDSSLAGKQSWTCESMGCYRDMPAGDACFSEEGSLLAVAFGNVATLWTVNNTMMKAALCHGNNNACIKQLVFGRKSLVHLLVCHDTTSITVWNVLSLSITWIVHTTVQCLVSDPYSDIVAAFCQDQSLILFRPNNPMPLETIDKVSEHEIIAALFVPSKNDSSGILEKSQLLFFDSNHNLFTLTDEIEEEINSMPKVPITQNLPVTPFGILQAENKVSHVVKSKPEFFDLLNSGKNLDLDISNPTLMEPMALCAQILKSLLIPAKKTDISED